MSGAVSGEMATCLQFAREHGGRLIRFQGGYWSYRGAPMPDGVPRPYFGGSTIKALVKRKLMIYTEYRDGRNGKFPIAVELAELTDQAAA